MKLSCVTSNHIILAAGSKLFVFDVNSTKIQSSDTFKVLELSSNGSQVLSITCNRDHSILLVAYSDKKLISYDLNQNKLVAETVLRKRVTAMECAGFQSNATGGYSEVLVISDKAGDILGVDVPLLKRSVHLGGHTSSVITDLAVVGGSGGDSGYVLTSDRDEKIRISRFPHCEAISAYCLGHTSVVTSLAVAHSVRENSAPSRVLSCSWDNTLAVWDVETGARLSHIHLLPEQEKPPSAPAVSEGDGIDEGENEEVADEAAEANDDEDELPEKLYDERSAGNYPLQVVCSGSTVAVSFRNLPEIRLYTLSPSGELHFERAISTPSLPVQLFWASTEVLVAVCAKPHYIFSYPLGSASDGKNVNSSAMMDALVRAFQSFCTSNDIEFTQQIVFSGENDTEAGSLGKHIIDRPFTHLTGVALPADEDGAVKNNSKKSRKRTVGDAGVEDPSILIHDKSS